MIWFIELLKGTVGRKAVIGLTGLGLCLFILIHMLGNLLILQGPAAYNSYAHKLHSLLLFEVLETGLALFFAGHILLTVLTAVQNFKARGEKQHVPSVKKAASFTDRTLAFQGLVLLIFLVFHLMTFKFGPFYETSLNGEPVRDIHRLVREVFQNPWMVIVYSAVLFVLCGHLSHGLQAALKSLGISHPRYDPALKVWSVIFAWTVFTGFLIQPLYVYFILPGG